MRCYFLVYEKDGKKGNDLTNKNPFNWLIDNRQKYSESELIVLRWLQVDVPQQEYNGVEVQIGIEADYKEPEKPVQEPNGRPRGWALKKEFVDSNGDVYRKGKLVEGE
jgi:hypothetical protein